MYLMTNPLTKVVVGFRITTTGSPAAGEIYVSHNTKMVHFHVANLKLSMPFPGNFMHLSPILSDAPLASPWMNAFSKFCFAIIQSVGPTLMFITQEAPLYKAGAPPTAPLEHGIECGICLAEMHNGSTNADAIDVDNDDPCVIKLATCSHIFHNKCIHSWLKVKQACPTCRRPVADKMLCENRLHLSWLLQQLAAIYAGYGTPYDGPSTLEFFRSKIKMSFVQ